MMYVLSSDERRRIVRALTRMHEQLEREAIGDSSQLLNDSGTERGSLYVALEDALDAIGDEDGR